MGQLRFIVPHRDRLPDEALQRVYCCGMEGVPWRCQSRWLDPAADDSHADFVVERSVNDSGNLFVPWEVNGDELTLSTATLMERKQPYNLPVELARGLLNRLKNQSADWHHLFDLPLPVEFQSSLREAARCFGRATTVCETDAAAAECAEDAIRHGLAAMDFLLAEYVTAAVTTRQRQPAAATTMFGVRLCQRELVAAEKSALVKTSNAAAVGCCWRELERTAGQLNWQLVDDQIAWCQSAGLRIVGGPLLQLGPGDVPDWLYLWEDDFEEVQAYVIQYIRSVVERLKGKVHVWNCAARVNVPGALSITEEQELRLVVNAIEEVRREDPSTPLIVSVDRPWAEYLAGQELDLSPLHIADSLLRAELGIAGIGLELNIGYWPGGTLPRDLLEVSAMLDRWSYLGIPLLVFVTLPSDTGRPAGASEKTFLPLPQFAGGATPESQCRESQNLIRLMLAKHFIQGIFWNQLSDADDPVYAYSGLFDGNNRPKPIVDTLKSIHTDYLS